MTPNSTRVLALFAVMLSLGLAAPAGAHHVQCEIKTSPAISVGFVHLVPEPIRDGSVYVQPVLIYLETNFMPGLQRHDPRQTDVCGHWWDADHWWI